MAFRSFLSIVVLMLYPRLQCRLGTVLSYQLSMLLWPTLIAFLPISNSLSRQGTEASRLLNMTMTAFFFVWSLAGRFLVSAGQRMIIIDAVPSAEALKMCVPAVFAFSPGCCPHGYGSSVGHRSRVRQFPIRILDRKQHDGRKSYLACTIRNRLFHGYTQSIAQRAVS